MVNKQEDIDKLTALVQNTKRIAEGLILLQQEDKTKSHKIDIIGTAIIRQRDNIQRLVDDTTQIHEALSQQVIRSDEQKNNINQLIDTADDRFRCLQKTHKMQHEFISSFDRLQEKHQELIEANNDNYEEYNRTLNTMIEAVTHLQSKLDRMDIIHQTKTLADDIQALLGYVQDYMRKREAAQQQLQASIKSLRGEIEELNQVLRPYQQAIYTIKGIVEHCREQTITIDNKLDLFIEQYNINVQRKMDTLDNTFEQPDVKTKPSRGFFARLFRGDNHD